MGCVLTVMSLSGVPVDLLAVCLMYLIISISVSFLFSVHFLLVFVGLTMITLHEIRDCPKSFHAYCNMLGKPNTGVHSVRIYGVPIVDFVISMIGGYILSIVFQTELIKTNIFFWLFGQLVHYVFGVNTSFLNYIGIKFEA
jgi:hypothetical protein